MTIFLRSSGGVVLFLFQTPVERYSILLWSTFFGTESFCCHDPHMAGYVVTSTLRRQIMSGWL